MATQIGRPSACGRCGACPRCKHAAYMRQWYADHSLEERRAMRQSRNPDVAREQDRRKQAKRRLHGTEDQQLKIGARNEVRKARLRGDLIVGECTYAGLACSGRMEAHHDDYEKPLEVRWFCRHHHDEFHAFEAAA